jgi:hypothetical protein
MDDLELRAEKLAAKADAVATELGELSEQLSEQLAEVNRARQGAEAPDPGQVIMWIEELTGLARALPPSQYGARTILDQLLDYLTRWRDLQGGYID